jgi:NAD-specific glutamate dehydrogenase
LEHKQISKLVSGNYLAYNKNVKKDTVEQLHFDIELSPGVKPSTDLQKKITDAVVKTLMTVNNEYRKLYESLGKKALPMVKLMQFGGATVKVNEPIAMLNIKGKKPRMLLK